MRQTHLPGEEVAVVTMPTSGLIQPDGRDIRVLTVGGKELASRVLMVGPGDCVRLAFEALPKLERYYVYFGNEDAPPGKQLEIRRGLLLETWEYPGGGTGTLQQTREVFEKTSKLLGRVFRDRVFLGHNPFGPQRDIASIYTGWFIAPADGEYIFCSSSSNASYLLVDDELVVDNGGFHKPQRDIRKNAGVALTAGLHKLTFYHVTSGQDPVAVAAWRPPGRDRVLPIPPEAFTPVSQGNPGPMEEYGRPVSVDFLPEHLGETFAANHYYQRYGFEAVAAGRGVKNIDAQWRWDFGDGQSSTQKKVEHVYLVPGEYTVRLTAETPAGRQERTNRIYVSRPWDQVTQPKLDALKEHAHIVAKYNFEKLAPGAIAKAVPLLDRAEMPDAVLAAGRGFLAGDQAPAEAIARTLPIYVDALLRRGEAREAHEALMGAVEMTRNPRVIVRLATRAGQVWLQHLGKPTEARKQFKDVIERYGALVTGETLRDAQIGIGDAYRVEGEYERALEAYQAAGEKLDLDVSKQAIRKGDYARHVEAFLRKRKLEWAREYLDRWERAMPADKLEGFSTLLRARLLIAEKDYAAAAREAMSLVRVNPRSNYAPDLLKLAAAAYRESGNEDRAQESLRQLVENYPESPLAAEAADQSRDD